MPFKCAVWVGNFLVFSRFVQSILSYSLCTWCDTILKFTNIYRERITFEQLRWLLLITAFFSTKINSLVGRALVRVRVGFFFIVYLMRFFFSLAVFIFIVHWRQFNWRHHHYSDNIRIRCEILVKWPYTQTHSHFTQISCPDYLLIPYNTAINYFILRFAQHKTIDDVQSVCRVHVWGYT